VGKVDLKLIAKEAGVSPTLASQVLNNRAVRVAPETRERILGAAERHQYSPSRLATALKMKRTNTIAALVPFTSVGFFSELIFHIQAYAMERGFNTLVINTFGDRELEARALGLYRSRMMDGFIVAPQNAGAHKELFGQIGEDAFPFVFVDRKLDGVEGASVSSDHGAIAAELTRRLVAEGHREVLFLVRQNEAENSTMRSRRQAYAATMAEAGLEPAVLGFSHEGERADLAERLAARGKGQPEAIFLASGYYMPHLLSACARLGYDVGRMRFATVDPFVLPCEFLREKTLIERMGSNLLVAQQDVARIARSSVGLLIDMIEGKKVEAGDAYVPVAIFEI
jgi:LacI family transcriptional regulator